MSEAKHTPGPWHIADDGWNTTVFASDGFEVVDTSQGPHLHESYSGNDGHHWSDAPGVYHIERNEDEEQANARLIASAPELLKALKDVRYRLYGNGPGDPNMDAAIAKAQGRSS